MLFMFLLLCDGTFPVFVISCMILHTVLIIRDNGCGVCKLSGCDLSSDRVSWTETGKPY